MVVKVRDKFIFDAFLGDKTISRMYYGDDCIWPGPSMTRFLLGDGTVKNAWPRGDLAQSDVPADVVSAYIGGLVTSIGNNAFDACVSLSAVYVPDAVKSVGAYAFNGCQSLSGISLPGVESIGHGAFKYAQNLQSVDLGSSLASIADAAFYGCSSLTSLTFPTTLTSIGETAFKNCRSLLSVSLPDALQVINNNAFSTCTSCAVYDFGNTRTTIPQLKNAGVFEQCRSDMLILVPDSLYDTWIDATNWSDDSVKPHIVKWSSRTIVKYTAASGLPDWERDIVGELAYDSIPNKSHIVEVEIGRHVTSLGNGAFSGCSGLKSVTIPNSVTSIGGCAFSWCISLTSVTIPDSVRSIGREAFDRCSRLMSVTIGNSVTSIKWSTFSRCSGLTSVTIPDSVTSIEDGAFKGSNNIEVFDFGNTRSTIPQLANTNAFMDLGEDYKIVVPDALYENWSLSSTNWRDDSIRPHIKKWSEYQPLQFTAVDAGATIAFNKVGSPDDARIVTSTDGQAWTPYTFNDVITLANAGDKVYFRAADENDISFYTDDSNYYRFATTYKKKIAASGNIQTLMKADGSRLDISGKGNCYQSIFQYCSSLTTAPELIATTIADNCYYYMFNGCTSLTAAPALPATTLASSCYAGMFYNCSSLTTAPALPATTLASSCYYSMFYNCSSLTTAPALPAMTLANNCYTYMFKGCSSLASAPALPATTLAYGCYYSMFQNCSSLTTAPELPAMSLVHSCYSNMFNGCTSLTTAPELPAMSLVHSCYSNMFNGCTSLAAVPSLPATTLANNCYSNMFSGCSSLTGNTTVSLAQTSAIPNNALYQTFSQTTGQTQLTFILDLSDFTTIPQLPNADTISVFDSASDTRLTIKVPASLLTTWKDSSNWSNFADRIIAAT